MVPRNKLDASTVCIHDRPYQVQANAEPRAVDSRLIKALEDPSTVFSWDAWSVIRHLQYRFAVFGSQPNVEALAARRVLHGVGQQVEYHLLQAAGIAGDHQRIAWCIDADVLPVDHGLRQLDGSPHHFDEIYGFALGLQLACLDAHHVCQVVNQISEQASLLEAD